MTIKLMLVVAVAALATSAPAVQASTRHKTAHALRLVDSSCDGSTCERVYDRGLMSRAAADLTKMPRYIVRIEPDRSPVAKRLQPVTIAAR